MGIRFALKITSDYSAENGLEKCMPRNIYIIQAKDGNLCENHLYIILHIGFFLGYKAYEIIKTTHLKQSIGILHGNKFMFLT